MPDILGEIRKISSVSSGPVIHGDTNILESVTKLKRPLGSTSIREIWKDQVRSDVENFKPGEFGKN